MRIIIATSYLLRKQTKYVDQIWMTFFLQFEGERDKLPYKYVLADDEEE